MRSREKSGRRRRPDRGREECQLAPEECSGCHSKGGLFLQLDTPLLPFLFSSFYREDIVIVDIATDTRASYLPWLTFPKWHWVLGSGQATRKWVICNKWTLLEHTLGLPQLLNIENFLTPGQTGPWSLSHSARCLWTDYLAYPYKKSIVIFCFEQLKIIALRLWLHWAPESAFVLLSNWCMLNADT